MDTQKTGETRQLTREEILSRIRDDLLAARRDVAGIIVFGSFARQERWRDIDVLVVLESLETENRIRTALALDNAIHLDVDVQAA
jgi:predicted nucleotidyltransferase